MYLFITLQDSGATGRGTLSNDLALYGPAVHDGEWWRLVTSSLVHYGFIHILFNMLILWQVGMILEPGAGKARFTMLYVVSVLGGSAGALGADPERVHRWRVGRGVRRRGRGDARHAPPGRPLLGHGLRAAAC